MTRAELENMIRMEKRAALVINTRARQGGRLYERARKALEKNGIALDAAIAVSKPEELLPLVEDIIRQGARLVIVGGGDGTVSSVVDAFAYRDVVLGLLPLGTGNSLAQSLGIPFTVEAAIQTISQCHVGEIDLGKVNDDYFANVATIGLSADAARRIPPRLKQLLGPVAYGFAGLKSFLDHKPFLCHLSTAQFEKTVRTHMIIVANGRFYGRFPIAAKATLEDSALDVYVMGGASRLALIRAGIALVLQRHTSIYDSPLFATDSVSIQVDVPQYVDLDGEPTACTPVKISVAPKALRVMVPAR